MAKTTGGESAQTSGLAHHACHSAGHPVHDDRWPGGAGHHGSERDEDGWRCAECNDWSQWTASDPAAGVGQGSRFASAAPGSAADTAAAAATTAAGAAARLATPSHHPAAAGDAAAVAGVASGVARGHHRGATVHSGSTATGGDDSPRLAGATECTGKGPGGGATVGRQRQRRRQQFRGATCLAG